MRRHSCLLLLLLLGCNQTPPAAGPKPNPNRIKDATEHDGEPRTELERLLAKHILRGETSEVDVNGWKDGPGKKEPGRFELGSVKFIYWGPHDLTGKTHFHDPEKKSYLRVCYRAKLTNGPVTDYDQIFEHYTSDVPKVGLVHVFRGGYPWSNEAGDDWLDRGIAEKAEIERKAKKR